jgi:hypothetical protein
MFINIARLVWAFKFSNKPEAPVDIRAFSILWLGILALRWLILSCRFLYIDNFTAGFLIAPRPYQCNIEVRTPPTRMSQVSQPTDSCCNSPAMPR